MDRRSRLERGEARSHRGSPKTAAEREAVQRQLTGEASVNAEVTDDRGDALCRAYGAAEHNAWHIQQAVQFQAVRSLRPGATA